VLKESRGLPDALIRFDLAAVPPHLTVQLTVTQNGREIARGTDLAELRRRCAAAGRLELEHRAREVYAVFRHWRRFEVDECLTAQR